MVYKTHIRTLDDDSLLQIFNYYRQEQEVDWNFRLAWRTIAHVCRRWRHLVYDTSSHLGVCLLLTHDSPSLDTLSHLPPLPLAIDYSDRTWTITQRDEDNIRFGLLQHRRVRRVALSAPTSSLRFWLEPMNNLFPRLTDLSLLSTTTEEMGLVLPETFQAPDLRCLALQGIGLLKGFPSLSSMITLSTLSLTHIGSYSHSSPGHLVTLLQGLPHLEELSIGFASQIPLPSSEGEQVLAPISIVTLPSLKRLTFWGVDVYLENLVARINTPRLERLNSNLLFELAFTLVNLTKFILRTEGFECLVARIVFSKDSASMDAGHYGQLERSYGKLSLHVSCKRLDQQIDSATQFCSALGKVLFAVEELTLGLDVGGMPSNWENTLDSVVWLEILRPFVGVKKLHVGYSLTLRLSRALRTDARGLVPNLLPSLQGLVVQLGIDHAKREFYGFIRTRESVGRPVVLLAPPILPIPRAGPRGSRAETRVLYAEPRVPRLLADQRVLRADPEVPRAVHHKDSKEFLECMDHVRSPYRNRAMNLISTCRFFIQAQKQNFRSYDELRR